MAWEVKSSTPMRWIWLCAAGELVGFGLGGGIGYLVFTAIPDPRSATAVIALLLGCAAAGVIEGAALGAAQWWGLRRRYPRLPAAPWIGATSAAAAVAWLLGGLPSTLISLLAPAVAATPAAPGGAVVALATAAGGAVLGTLFGVLQWSVLRDHAGRPGAWIIANTVGWAIALPWSFVAASLPQVTTPSRALAVTAAAGLIMGVIVAVATGAALRRMPPRPATVR